MKYHQTDTPPVAAAKASFSTSTAYRCEKDRRLPSQKKGARGRRRPDPLASVFETEVVPMLKAAPRVRAVAIFEEMLRRHPEARSWHPLHPATPTRHPDCRVLPHCVAKNVPKC